MFNVQSSPIDALKPNPRNAHTHSKKQIRQIADSIAAFGFVIPILIDEAGNIIASYGRYEAAKLLSLKQVQVTMVQGYPKLSAARLPSPTIRSRRMRAGTVKSLRSNCRYCQNFLLGKV